MRACLQDIEAAYKGSHWPNMERFEQEKNNNNGIEPMKE